MRKPSHGFTIVELLVVVVVIAILAAIIIVVYKGIQDRANAARAASAASSYAKLLRTYQATYNTFPTSMTAPTWEYCLGKPSDYPASGVFAAGQCLYNPSGPYTVSTSQTLEDSLTLYGSTSSTVLPTARLGNETWRGMRYVFNPASSNPATIEWVVNGSVSCAPGTGTPGGWWGSTWCSLSISQ